MTKSLPFAALLAVLGVGTFFLPSLRVRPAIDPPAILLQVQKLNELATAKYTVQKVIGIKEEKQPVGSESILLVFQASVRAGVDLGALRPDDVNQRADGVVVIRMPPSRILSLTIDEQETKVWDRSKTWWTPWVPYSVDLEKRARLAGIDAVNKAVVEMGILNQAQQNAEASIRGVLALAGVKSVLIVPGAVS